MPWIVGETVTGLRTRTSGPLIATDRVIHLQESLALGGLKQLSHSRSIDVGGIDVFAMEKMS